MIKIDLITGLPRTRRQHDSMWFIVDRMTKSSCFLAVKTTYSVDDYAKFYHTEIVKLHGVPLSIISDRGPQLVLIFGSHFKKVLVLKLTLVQHFIHRRMDKKSIPFRP